LPKGKRIIGGRMALIAIGVTSHVHMVLGTDGKNKLEDIIRDMKSYTSRHIHKYMEHNPSESRKEWMLWMMEMAGRKLSNNHDFQF